MVTKCVSVPVVGSEKLRVKTLSGKLRATPQMLLLHPFPAQLHFLMSI